MPHYISTGQVAGNECSSTYEGRHVTVLESLMVHPDHIADVLVDKGDPVIVNEMVGVAFNSAAAVTDYIAIDTEGIWWLDVVATDDEGNSPVAVGDKLYINRLTAVLSKIANPDTNYPFGYAVTTLATGTTDIVAVKVHWMLEDSPVLSGLLETILVTGALSIWGSTYLDDTAGAIAGTLADGVIPGQLKHIVMSAGAVGSTISIAHHETSDPEVATFDAVDEYGLFIWTGTEWATVSGSCTFV